MFGKKLTKRYFQDESGQIAVITAVVAVPLMLCVSIAMDSHVTDRARVKLQASLDNAAIAAISDQTISTEERSEHAKERFWSNMSTVERVKFHVPSSTDNRIDVQGTMQVNSLFAGIIGRDNITFQAASAAEIVKGSTVCMLALDPHSGRAFEVTQGATLNANCTVQVNSLSNHGSVVDGGGTATAEGFCISGGAQGDYSPFANTECGLLDDPYKSIEIPGTTEPCVDQDELNALINDWRSTRDAVENHEIIENERWAEAIEAGQTWYPTYFEKNHLKPGNYCQGLNLQANEFILDPGEYHITGGDLTFGLGTELIGEGVTFILHNEAKLEARNGSVLNIKGPTSGPLEGLVMAQRMKGYYINNPSYPNVKSTITSGSRLNVLGTIYLPSHRIEFLGGSLSKTHAPATSFIAHQISVADGADITVSADHIAAGISPIKPRADSGVRLVR